MHILTEPANALVKQYQTQFRLDGIELSFTIDALRAIARKALRARTGTLFSLLLLKSTFTTFTGARSLRAVLERTLHDAMYEVPGTDIVEVHIDADVVNGKKPYVAIRSSTADDDMQYDASGVRL